MSQTSAPLGSSRTKATVAGVCALCAFVVAGALIYKIATFRVEVPIPKVERKKPLADCTKRLEVDGLWADPLNLKCGRSGEEGKLRSCARILYTRGFEKVRTCFNPATLGQNP